MAKSFCDDFIVNYTVDTNVDVLWSIFKDFCICFVSLACIATLKSHWQESWSPLGRYPPLLND